MKGEVFHTNFSAWSCKISLEVVTPTSPFSIMVEEVKQTLWQYEMEFSRFCLTSSVARLNRGETVKVSAEFLRVFEQAKQLILFTDGRFNPHINLSAHGYRDSFEQEKSSPMITESIPLVFPLGVLREGKTLRLKKGVTLDFGGMLKGYLAQKIAQSYAPICRGIIVNLGGDLYTCGDDHSSSGFSLTIKNPKGGSDYSLTLKNQALATSGTYKRCWKSGTQIKTHLVNPQTNKTAPTEIASISFWGPDGGLVDALSTASFFANSSDWIDWQKKIPNLGYLAIKEDGRFL